MPSADSQGFSFPSSVPFPSLGLSILSLRRDQVHAIDDQKNQKSVGRQELLAFQSCVTDHFLDLSHADADTLLSLSWVSKLLHAFITCHEEFRALVLDRETLVIRPPLDRLIADFSDRAVKALDICNATRDGIDHLRRCRAYMEIVITALGPANSGSSRQRLGHGQLRRARRALAELTVMLDDRDAGHPYRNRSFGRSNGAGSSASSSSPTGSTPFTHIRTLSSSVSRSWSAASKLQAMGSNVAPPRDQEDEASAGLAVPLYTMSTVLLFAMRSLVAAIPSQDHGFQAQFSIPRSFPWAAPIMSLHERIVEESKRKDRGNSTVLLKEIQQIEKCANHLAKVIDKTRFPITEEEEEGLRQGAKQFAQMSEALKEGLDTVESQVREIFLRIVRSRTESFDGSSHCAQ